MARRVGVSVGTMSGIETGKTSVSAERFSAIADALGTTVDAIGSFATAEAADESPPPFDWRVFPPQTLDPVLRAAVACFVDKGFHGTTMRTVAAAAGISVPGVYHHYESKQALLSAVLDLASTELTAHLSAAVDDVSDPDERFTNLCTALILFATHRADLTRVALTERAGADPDRVAALMASLHETLRRELTAAGADADAATAVADLCLGVSRRFDPAVDRPADVAARYTDYCLRLALLASPDSAS